jgi:hypothetical protein
MAPPFPLICPHLRKLPNNDFKSLLPCSRKESKSVDMSLGAGSDTNVTGTSARGATVLRCRGFGWGSADTVKTQKRRIEIRS